MITSQNDFSPLEFPRHILVVGSWAKCQITIENIRTNNPDIEVFVYMSIRNPGIISLVDRYKIGKFSAINDIVEYSKNQNIDLVIITTAEPLSLGLVDLLQKEGIAVFGPTQQAACLESDKAFARELMRKYEIDAIPQFQVFNKVDDAIQYAKELNWYVAVKPIGLTEGLGVKVFGEQLKTEDEVIQYIKHVLTQMGDSRVLIEEKLVGEEFTIQCLVNGNQIIPTPAVQDFKKLLVGDKGPNTASMGSYTDTGYLLPFMTQKDYDTAIEIIRKTLAAFFSDTKERCQGFLYGQFMLTEKGIKLIEYNFRPGDPEWMNTLFVLKSNILDVIYKLMKGEDVSLQFENKATVCKYIVPRNYPQKLYEVLNVNFEEHDITAKGVKFYYSCGIDDEGKLNVGSERGIAFIAKDNNIFDANEKVEQAISLIKGDFNYRSDIGTREQITSKITYIERLRQ